jgi:hypothetical protein
MAKKIVINKSSGPISAQLTRHRTLKIRARGVAEVEEADLNCPALLFYQRRGYIVIADQPPEKS